MSEYDLSEWSEYATSQRAQSAAGGSVGDAAAA